MMKCILCNTRKTETFCERFNGEICKRCCGSKRNWCECNLSCNFPEEIEPQFYIKGGNLQNEETGDIIYLSNFLFLPNIYNCIDLELVKFNLFYENLQILNADISFKLHKNFESNIDDILLKDSWKKNFYPFPCESQNLQPLIGISLLKRGMFSLSPDEVQLNISNYDISPLHWIIGNTFQRPYLPSNNKNSPVEYIFARNLMIFGELKFDFLYELKLKFYNINEPNYNDNTVLNRFGLIFPYGKSSISPPNFIKSQFVETINNEGRIFYPKESNVYPGENHLNKGLNLLSTRENVNALHASFSHRTDGNETINGLSLYSFNFQSKIKNDVIASLLVHNKSVNPKLFFPFLNWLGNNSAPLHLNLINFSKSAHKILVKCNEQVNGKIWQDIETLNPRSEVNMPINLSGLLKGCTGQASIFIEVFSDNNLIYQDSVDIKILPEDHLLLYLSDLGRDWHYFSAPAAVCWVTPHDSSIDNWISDSRKHISHGVFDSSLDPKDIIRALWSSLEDYGISYVDRSFSIGSNPSNVYQRITKPSDTLSLKSGNCIDLTVLFASALENLSLEPIIVLIPGHAFLGWESNNELDFLETTMIGNNTFDSALDEARNRFKEYEDKFEQQMNFKKIRVSEFRKKGLNPIFD